MVYLKVKLRKEGSVSRADYADVRDRLQDLRTRARSDVARQRHDGMAHEQRPRDQHDDPRRHRRRQPVRRDDRRRVGPSRTRRVARARGRGRASIPVGQEIDVRLQGELSSDTAQVEHRFEATTVADLYRGNEVLIPAGSVLRGVVSSVQKATRTDRKGSLTVSFDQITVRGRQLSDPRHRDPGHRERRASRARPARIGTGGAVGAIIGGILGGVKGAMIGVLIGGGGTIAATEGKDVTLPPGTILRVRLDTPPEIR